MLLIVPTTPTIVNSARAASPNLLPDGTARREVTVHEILIDDDDGCALTCIGFRERTPLENGNLHRAEVVAADNFLATVGRGLRWTWCIADD